MNERLLEELVRVIAYGGGGILLGYALGLWTSDRHALISTVLNEPERTMPTRRPFLSTNRIQTLIVVLVMIALLLTGVAWLRAEQENAQQDERDCRTLAAISQTLRERTAVYQEAAEPQRTLWLDLRRTLMKAGVKPGEPIIRSIDTYLDHQATYIAHLERNPYPRNVLTEC